MKNPSRNPPETVATVEIDADDYLGRDIDEVEEELEELGFTVDRVERQDTEPAGTVLALSPTGEVEEGSEIRVSFSDGTGVEPAPAPVNQAEPEPEPEPERTRPGPAEPAPTTGNKHHQRRRPKPLRRSQPPTTQAPAPDPTTTSPTDAGGAPVEPGEEMGILMASNGADGNGSGNGNGNDQTAHADRHWPGRRHCRQRLPRD